MIPVLFHIGPLPVYSFGLMVATGVILSLYLMSRESRATGFPPGDMAFDMVFCSVISGFLGARLYYVFQNLDLYLKNPLHIFAIWEGGLIFYGGMISSFIGLWAFLKVKKIPFLRGLDFILPYVALTHGFGRLGCFLNGCCYGKVCDLPWAVKYPDLVQAVHPAQLYEAAVDFVLFLFLRFRAPSKEFNGEISALYFMIYAVGRFVIEFFRDENPHLGIFTVNQIISLTVFALAAGYYFASKRKYHAGT